MACDGGAIEGRRVIVLGACCAGKTTLASELQGLEVVESDAAVLAAAGGVWPADLDEIHRLVIETAERALARDEVVLITSFVPTDLLRSVRASGGVIAVLDVPSPRARAPQSGAGRVGWSR